MGSAPRPVADLLSSALPQLDERLAAWRLGRAWPGLVGPEVARRARPATLAGGSLTVLVDNSPWLQELHLRQAELLGRVQAAFPEVRALRFALGALPAAERGERRSGRPAARRLGAGDWQAIDAATAALRDPEVAAAARRLLVKARQFPAPEPPRP